MSTTRQKLTAYRRKRDFDTTPEPRGGTERHSGERRFVVQRHRARALHYDLRFEVDGVLVSWAVPKGPTLDPEVKRMAVHVEDHPMEYLNFEGVIPRGEYGGGDVIVWDRGTWTPYKSDNPGKEIAEGELHAEVYGEKLRGRFVLIRRDDKPTEKSQWLLLHKKDEHAVSGWDPEEHPRSVLSGRTNDEVKASPRRLWRSDKPAKHAEEDVSQMPETVDTSGIDVLGKEGVWQVHGRELKVTNLDKVLFPPREGEEAVTKRDLLRYAAAIAPTILPYVEGRAMNLHRYPNGANSKGFWHKEVPDHAPEWLPRWDNPLADPGETTTYLVVDEPAALVWAANFGALEWHPWTSRTDAPECPTYAMFDIDPGERTSWEQVLGLARLHRTAFEKLHVRAYPKVTGSRGIQIWVPIRRGSTFDQTRAWVERVSKTIGRLVPDQVSWKWQKDQRGGKARLDYTQNAINKTLVAPFSPRPRPGAPVSVPIGWHELDDPELRPDRWTIRTVLDRLEEVGDPFAGVLVDDQVLQPFI